MVFISEIIGKPVTDVDGRRIGSFKDFIVHLGKIPHPQVIAMLIKRGKQMITVPASDIVILTAPGIPIRKRLSDVNTFPSSEQDLYLVRDVLDKQIIDVNGIRVVRVNDLELTNINGDIYVSNVDVGSGGIFRRLGMTKVADWIETAKQDQRHYLVG